MFTIKQIEAFKLIAQHGSVALAAAHLCTTESAVAKRLREFESLLGVNLFQREGRRQVLTAKGQEMLRLSLTLLETCAAIREVASSPEFQDYTVRLGLTELVAHHWLTELVERLRLDHPRLLVEPHIGLSLDMMDLVRQGDLDLAVLPVMARTGTLAYVPLFKSENLWVSRPDYVQQQALGAADLCRTPLILQHRQSLLHQTVQQWFAERDAPVPRLIICNHLKGVKDLVMAGVGIAFLPEHFCREDIEAGRLKALEVRPAIAARTYCVVYRRRSSSLLAKLAGTIQEVVGRSPVLRR